MKQSLETTSSHQRPPVNTIDLLNEMLTSKGIQKIIDIGFKLFGNPILLADANHRLLACTKDVEVQDLEWHHIVEKGYVSFSNVTVALKEVFDMAKKNPILDVNSETGTLFIRNVITIDGQVAAYLTIPGYFRSFDDYDLKIAELLSNVLLLDMQRNKFSGLAKGSICESFVTDLLNGKTFVPNQIQQKLSFLKWNLKEFIYVLTVRADRSGGVTEMLSVNEVKETLQEQIAGSKAVLFNNDIVVVFSCSREITCHETKFGDLIKLMKKKHLFAGISRAARSLADIHHCYRQSIKAIEIGTQREKNKIIFSYESYTIYHLLGVCAEHENLMAFCHPHLLTLLDYDRKNDTSFVHSLRTYLEHDKNLAKTAAALHIHRNTMSYRLDKIAEVMNLDLCDSNVVLQLFLSFKILEHIKDDCSRVVSEPSSISAY